MAIVGIYFVRDSGLLFQCLDDIIAEDIRVKGEYQLTDGLQRMIERGEELLTFPVDDWWDCGNPDILLETNRELLSRDEQPAVQMNGTIIVPPVAIDPSAKIERSVIGPYVSVAAGVTIRDSIIRDSIINEGACVSTTLLDNSLIGEDAEVRGNFARVHIGDSSSMFTGVRPEQE